MILLTILLSTYILAVNFYGFRLLKTQRDGFEAGEKKAGEGDGKLMLALPLLAVINVYCFYLGFRGIFLIW